MSAPVLGIPSKVLRSPTAGRRPGDGNFRALTDGELFVNTQDKVLAYLNAAGALITMPVDPALFAMLASPAFTGAPTAPTPAAGTNTAQIATAAFVQAAVTAILNQIEGGAPAALSTLKELADAIADDAGFAATTASALGNRLRFDGPQALTAAQVAQALANLAVPLPPQGRLTLTSGSPLCQPGTGTTIFYTPDKGQICPVWNGTVFAPVTFAEVNQALSDNTKSPALAAAGNVYDLFGWLDGSTFRVTRGQAWSSSGGSNTARGTGANSAALTRVNGLLVNAVAITNGPAAAFGTYLGTIATDPGAATVSFVPTSLAPAGGTATIGLWNAFNRRPAAATASNSSSSWTSQTSATPREVQGGPFRVQFVTGQAEDAFTACYQAFASVVQNTNASGKIGLALDSTTSFDRYAIFLNPSASQVMYISPLAQIGYSKVLGLHFVAALEASDGIDSHTFYGGSQANALTVNLRY